MRFTITASMLYNLIQCPHRLNLDLHEDPSKKDLESKFVELLWEKGTLFESEVIGKLQIPFTDLSIFSYEEKELRTLEAIKKRTKLIYSGRIRSGNLLGEPDILRFDERMGYVAGDIKSGAGEEGDEDEENERPKKHYAVQLAHYNYILENLGFSSSRLPFIWDVHGKEVIYDLNAPQGPRTPQSLWELYLEKLDEVSSIVSRSGLTLPALASKCKQCHWHSLCKDHIKKLDDLTLIAELGRAKRDAMLPYIKTVNNLAKNNLCELPSLRGISRSTLEKFQARAKLLIDPNAVPYCTELPIFPTAGRELFFDIEVDPMRDICYLHGFMERNDGDNSTEKFIPFMAETSDTKEEERAFAEAWKFVRSCQPCAIYFYSKYERTWWRKLQKRYPAVATEADIESMFAPDRAVDLYYDVVKRFTEWPTHDHSIKTLASHLGFKWRDTSPSGADSIEWYHRWVETGDPEVRQRILDYNEDDCRATRVLLDGIRKMKAP
jgi:predicted RecB family nuclease